MSRSPLWFCDPVFEGAFGAPAAFDAVDGVRVPNVPESAPPSELPVGLREDLVRFHRVPPPFRRNGGVLGLEVVEADEQQSRRAVGAAAALHAAFDAHRVLVVEFAAPGRLVSAAGAVITWSTAVFADDPRRGEVGMGRGERAAFRD